MPSLQPKVFCWMRRLNHSQSLREKAHLLSSINWMLRTRSSHRYEVCDLYTLQFFLRKQLLARAVEFALTSRIQMCEGRDLLTHWIHSVGKPTNSLHSFKQCSTHRSTRRSRPTPSLFKQSSLTLLKSLSKRMLACCLTQIHLLLHSLRSFHQIHLLP